MLMHKKYLNEKFSTFYLARHIIAAHLEQLQLVPNLLKIFEKVWTKKFRIYFKFHKKIYCDLYR